MGGAHGEFSETGLLHGSILNTLDCELRYVAKVNVARGPASLYRPCSASILSAAPDDVLLLCPILHHRDQSDPIAVNRDDEIWSAKVNAMPLKRLAPGLTQRRAALPSRWLVAPRTCRRDIEDALIPDRYPRGVNQLHPCRPRLLLPPCQICGAGHQDGGDAADPCVDLAHSNIPPSVIALVSAASLPQTPGSRRAFRARGSAACPAGRRARRWPRRTHRSPVTEPV